MACVSCEVILPAEDGAANITGVVRWGHCHAAGVEMALEGLDIDVCLTSGAYPKE